MQRRANIFLFLGVAVFVGGVLYLLKSILTPFLIAALLSYLANPLVTKLSRFHLPRLLRVSIVFFSLFAVLILFVVLMIPLVQKQISALIEVIPKTITWLQQSILPWLAFHLDVDQSNLNADIIKTNLAENWTKAGGVADWLVKAVFHSGLTLIEWAINLILIPVVTFYLLCDWQKLLNGICGLLPRNIEPTIVKLSVESDEVLSAFFRGQLIVMLILGIVYSLALTLVGLKVGLLIGILTGLLSIVPYLGFICGLIVASIAALVQDGSLTTLSLVCGVFIFTKLFEDFVLLPNLMGDRIGLHPVAVIFAILSGGALFGFFGILLALPVAAVVMVLIRFGLKRYRKSDLYCAG